MAKIIHKPIIFLPIECTPRELDYKLNLARIFCNNGLDVILGNPPFIRDELKYTNYKGVFLEKGCNPDPEYYDLLKKKGILLYCLCDEGANFPAFKVNYQPVIETLKLMKYIFLWGQGQLQDLIQRNSDKELNKKYVVSGYPGIEFSLPKYKEYHKKFKPKMLPSEKYILVNTNFGLFNGFSLEHVLESCSLMSPDTKKAIEASYEKEEILFNKFYNSIKKIVVNFPKENFLFRPHPTEKINRYKDFFSDFKNVIISREGNINNAISSAKLVIHNDCTSALQSYLMEVPVISLADFNEDTNMLATWTSSFGVCPITVEKACYYIKYVLKYNKLPDDVEEVIKLHAENTISNMFNNLGNSTNNIFSIIIKDISSRFKTFHSYKLNDTRNLLSKAKYFIRKYLPLHYKVPVASRGLLVEFTKRDIELRLSFLQNLENNPCFYNVKKIFPNVFKISKK